VSGGEPIFTRDGDSFVPTAQAVGPWDPGQLHGGAPGALIARAIQALAPQMQLARITFEFRGPVPLAPLEVEAEIVKPGGRLQLAQASVASGGRSVLTATATLLRRGDMQLPGVARWTAPLPAAPPDDPSHVGQQPTRPGFHTSGMTIRFANATGYGRPGPAQAWFRLQRDLVAGEQIPPVCRAVAAADFANGISSVLDWDEWLFVNCDLTVTLLQDPRTPWVLLDAATQIDTSGVGCASATLFDEHGPIGFARQTLFVAPR
jgi:hypothetical protein